MSTVQNRTPHYKNGNLSYSESLVALQSETQDPDIAYSAFETVYEAHHKTVEKVASRITGDPHMAEDVTQEAFLKLWEKRATIDPERESIGPYLNVAAKNTALNQVRASTRSKTHTVDAARIVDRTKATEGNPASYAHFMEIAKAFNTISPAYKAVFELYAAGVIPQELSGILGISEGAAKTKAWRACQAARQALKSELGLEI